VLSGVNGVGPNHRRAGGWRWALLSLLLASGVAAAGLLRVARLVERSDCFVLGRADLTDPALTAHDVAAVRARAAKYLGQTRGLGTARTQDLRIAWRPYTMLLHFSLTPGDLRRFLADKARVDQTAADVMQELRQEGAISVSRRGADQSLVGWRTTYQLQRYPFNRLGWWPPGKVEMEHMVVYYGKVWWDISEVRQGSPYYIFVGEGGRSIYLLGN
jgi:hypothetical protein